MATAEPPALATADDRAWDLFFEALDPSTASGIDIPAGAAILSAETPDCKELVRRYHADRRSVVLVHEDGHTETLPPRHLDRGLLIGGIVVLALLVWRAGSRVPA